MERQLQSLRLLLGTVFVLFICDKIIEIDLTSSIVTLRDTERNATSTMINCEFLAISDARTWTR